MNESATTPGNARPSRDRLSVLALATACLAAVTCVPFLAMIGGVMGLIARRRARAAGTATRLATAAIAVSAVSIVLQWALWDLSSRWLLPAMQRRMSAAVTAACEGRWREAVPAEPGFALAAPLPAPSEAAVQRFAALLREARGALRSVSLVNQEISGSPMSPTVITALVLEFEGGSATGSARLQWLPSAAETEAPWLPVARLLELEVSDPSGGTMTLSADVAAPAAAPTPEVRP